MYGMRDIELVKPFMRHCSEMYTGAEQSTVCRFVTFVCICGCCCRVIVGSYVGCVSEVCGYSLEYVAMFVIFLVWLVGSGCCV